jgi:hypothetical protein
LICPAILDIIHPLLLSAPNPTICGFPSFVGIGTIGIDNIAFCAKSFKDLAIHDFHNLDDSTAAHTKNRVTATQSMAIIIFPIGINVPAISSLTNHHKISSSEVHIGIPLRLFIMLTKTADKLIAKQIIAGEKIIGIKFSKLKYSRDLTEFLASFIRPKAVKKTIKGDNAIATQRTQILIMNTIIVTNRGIDIAIICPRLKAAHNKSQNIHVFFGIIPTVFINDEYNAVKTPT